MRLGLTNVFRYPAGYLGRVAARPELAPAGFAASHGLARGELFPDWSLSLAGGARDLAALGLPPTSRAVTLEEIPADLVLVALFNPLCSECRREAANLERLHRAVEADAALAGRVAVLGVGSQCSRQALARFRQELGLSFAMALDERGALFHELGQETLPAFFLLRRGPESGRVAALVRHGRLDESATLRLEMRRLLP